MTCHKVQTQQLNHLKTLKNVSLIWLKKDFLEPYLGLLLKNPLINRKTPQITLIYCNLANIDQ